MGDSKMSKIESNEKLRARDEDWGTVKLNNLAKAVESVDGRAGIRPQVWTCNLSSPCEYPEEDTVYYQKENKGDENFNIQFFKIPFHMDNLH